MTEKELKHMFCIFPFFCFFISFISQHMTIVPTMAYPLSTSSRWIIDESAHGQRVKLACVNWPSHLEPVVAEGLSKQPVDALAKKIVDMGFNCVRLTWPLDLMTNETLANNITVRQSFQSFGLKDDTVGFQTNNPSMVDLSLIEAFKMVVATLGNNDVMVILDNHLTKPGWCCANNDGNGFFNDRFFDPTVWTAALSKMAATFDGVTNVVGMSLRNELRGPKQNVDDWFKYMQEGAEAVHSTNKNVLVILSGLKFDTDLSFVNSRPIKLSFTGKLVFELHWYAFTDGNSWTTDNPNDNCGRVLNRIENNGGFLLNKGFPLFLSEFGIDERGKNTRDDIYFGCLTGWATENDVDWSLWALTGSYYLREGVAGMIEYFGLLDSDWTSIRNSNYLQKISLLQSCLQRPDHQSDSYSLIFHPLTGLCLGRFLNDTTVLSLGPCILADPWSYTNRTLRIKNQTLCLQSNGQGKEVTVTQASCSRLDSKWQTISASKMHLASTTSNNTSLCLDVDATNNAVTNACKCLSKDGSCEPMSQWFKIINATLPVKSSGLHKQMTSSENLSPKSDLL